MRPPLLSQTRDFCLQKTAPFSLLRFLDTVTALQRSLANAYYASAAHSVICLSSVKAIETVLVSGFLSYEPEPLWIRTKK